MLGRTNAGGGGGGGLNFKVVPNPQPSNPKENTIWVDTDKINNYYFSATQPENMVDFDVWFPTGTSSHVAFNATKKNVVQVYPLSAKQYISGKLVDVEAESYQGNEWVLWSTDLVIFASGQGAVQGYATKKGSGTISVSTTKITVNGDDVVYYTTSKINTAGYKTLRLTGKFPTINTDYNYTGFGLMSSVPIADNFATQSGWVSSKEIASPSSASKSYDCPISGSGSYYVVFCGANVVGEITDIRLLK